MSGFYLKLFVDTLQRYQKLEDAEFGQLIRAALYYKASGQELPLSGRIDFLWDGLKQDIDRDNEAYQRIVEQRRAAGRMGAAHRWKNHTPAGEMAKEGAAEENPALPP